MTIETNQAEQILAKLDQLEIESQSARQQTLDKLTELQVGFVRAEEQLKGIDQRLQLTEERIKAQDQRLWGFVAVLVLGLFTLIGKLAFFPSPLN